MDEYLIVGIGTRYAGDDAAGLLVAESLQGRSADRAAVITHEGDGASLVESLLTSRSVVMIDAMDSGAEPGAVRRFNATAQPLPAHTLRHSTHAFGVGDAVELARVLQQLPPRVIVYGIEGRNFQAGDRLSPEVEAAVPGVVERVLEEMKSDGIRG
jgi:hydrogenase maturation protease